MNNLTTALVLQSGSGSVTIIYFVAMVAIMYFLIILPQRRERKKHQEMVDSLKASDQVVTFGGLVGEVLFIKDDLVTIKTGDSKVVVERARIARRVTPTSA
jgi:preprotein translocase subunit YajC